jgi:cyd operon protein YbgT
MSMPRIDAVNVLDPQLAMGEPIQTQQPTRSKGIHMWYFAWVLGVGFAVLLAILNAMWGENEDARAEARKNETRP